MQLEQDAERLRHTFREHITSSFGLAPDEALQDDDDLLIKGIVDSMGVMELVAFIESTFDVTVDDTEIISENFCSVEALTHYVSAKKGIDLGRRFVEDIRRLVSEGTPPGAVVLLLTSGDDELLEVGDRHVWHFPRGGDGQYASGKPVDGAQAVTDVERLRSEGATHLVFPKPELWWLDYYTELRSYLQAGDGEIMRSGTGVVYALRSRAMP